jgi:taurine dioxygenase
VPALRALVIASERQEDAAEVSRLESTYQSAADKPDDMRKVRLTGWHTDDSYFPVPAKATLLQALAIPKSGGQTGFANMQAAYEDLPEAMKACFDGLRARHRYHTRRAMAPPPELTTEEQADTQEAVHPLVRVHEQTGRKAIYFNANRTDGIVGLSESESDSLLDRLHEHTIQAKYQYHHSWRVGDILLWDNRCLIHSVNMDFPVGQRRLHQRILLAGTPPA